MRHHAYFKSPPNGYGQTSSAVTISRKVHLKKTSSSTILPLRFIRFLPSSSSDPHPPILSTNDDKPLKRAHFILPQIAIVYPISFNPPSTPTKEEKRAIEHQEADRRRKIVRGSRRLGIHHDWWSMDKVDECYVGCDEEPDPAVSAGFKVHSVLSYYFGSNSLCSTLPLPSHEPLICLVFNSPSPLLPSSPTSSPSKGLRKLVFRECVLDDQVCERE